MRRACLLLFLSISARAWQEPQSLPVDRVRRRMAENLAHLPNYTCLETIDRSVRRKVKDKLVFRDRIRLEVGFIEAEEMFGWPGSSRFEPNFLQQIPQAGASGIGSFGGITNMVFGSSAPAFAYAGECTADARRGSRYEFRVPLFSSKYEIRFGGRAALSAYAGSLCVDPDKLDVMMLDLHAEDVPLAVAPVGAVSEVIHYRRARIGSAEFLLPQQDELTITELDGNVSHNLTRFTECRQYAAQSSLSFDEDRTAAPVQPNVTQDLKLPGGIKLDVRLETPIAFEDFAVGDPITARLNRAIDASGVSIPKGATLSGRVWELEQYYRPEKAFVVGLEFSSLTFAGGRALFHARLVGPRLAIKKRLDANAMGMETTATAHTEETGLEIDDSSPRGTFRVWGGSLRLTRGFHIILETQNERPGI